MAIARSVCLSALLVDRCAVRASAGRYRGANTEAVVDFPPRCGKTLVTSICYPAWTWARSERAYLSGPQVRFLCGSYNDDLSLQNSTKHRRLMSGTREITAAGG